MTNFLKVGLLILFIVQLTVISGFELAHDEAYYWLFSRHLDWGYFDHPPFMAVLIRCFSFLPHSEFSVRIGFVLAQFVALFFLLKLIPKRLNFLAVIMFFTLPLASLSGLLALPDMPLLLMSTLYFWSLKRYLEKSSLDNILLLGLIIAFLFYAKYHGVLLIFFTILAIPKLLFKKDFYLVALISLILFLPHIFWQYEHHLATLRYHFIERPGSSFNWKRTLEYIGIQLGLAGLLIGPVVWWTTWKFKSSSDFERAVKLICFGTVVFFFISSFSKKIEANWTIFLAPALVYLSCQSDIWNKKIVKSLLYISFGLVVFARLILIAPVGWLNIKRLNEFHGWKSWSEKIKMDCGNQKIIANSYQIASKLSFYLNENIQALNYHSRKNQFDFWRFDREYQTDSVCYVTDKSEFTGPERMTPDLKRIKVIKNESLAHLQKLKYSEN